MKTSQECVPGCSLAHISARAATVKTTAGSKATKCSYRYNHTVVEMRRAGLRFPDAHTDTVSQFRLE